MALSTIESSPPRRSASALQRLLGREPRGLRAIAVADTDGEPIVIRVASVVEQKPFPTLYWLIGRNLSLHIDRLEAAGWIARLAGPCGSVRRHCKTQMRAGPCALQNRPERELSPASRKAQLLDQRRI